MLRTITATMLATSLACLPVTAAAQTGTGGQASYAALTMTAGAQLDSILLAMAQRKFGRTEEAIKLTGDAIEYAEQLNASLKRLASDRSGDQATLYGEAEQLSTEILELLREQRTALEQGDRQAYGRTRVAIYQRVSDLPDPVFVGPEGQPENER